MKSKIFTALLFIVCIFLSGCNQKMTEDEIKKSLEVNNDERTFTVNKVTFATDKTIVKDIEVEVKGETIKLGDYSFESKGDSYKQITGYFDQPSDMYIIFVLSDNAVWEIKKNSQDTFDNATFESKNIVNATDLVLIDCDETTTAMGETPLKNQVYALVNNKLKLIS